MFTTLVPMIFCLLFIYPRAWSIDAAPKCNVSQSLIDKHILVDNRPIPDIPFQDIVDRFSVSQRNFKSQKMRQHLFITTPNLSVTVSALKTAYSTKVEGGASESDSTEDFFVYEFHRATDADCPSGCFKSSNLPHSKSQLCNHIVHSIRQLVSIIKTPRLTIESS